MELGVKRTIKNYCIKPKYIRPEEKRQMEKIPFMEYTSKENLEFIKKKDKEVKADYFRQIEKDVTHISKNRKKNKVIQFTKLQIWYGSGKFELKYK